MRYELSRMLDGSRWLMEPSAFAALLQRAMQATEPEVQAAMVAYDVQRSEQQLRLVGDVAVIDACGPIMYKGSWLAYLFGCCTIEGLQAQLRMAMADPACRNIVVRWDSPGGTIDMVPEFAEELHAMRGKGGKAIYSVADTMIASAAYWLAAQSDAIYASESSQLGSVGVYCEHVDISGMLEKAGVKVTLISHGAHKTDGNPYESLSEEARATYQASVDQVGADFEAAVARGRGVTRKVVVDTYGQGLVFRGKQALDLGLADKRGTFSDLLARLTRQKATGAGAGLRGQAVAGLTDDLLAGKRKRADTMEPEDGECEDGYEMGEDGMCHLMAPEDEEGRRAAADSEAIVAALGPRA